MEGKLFLQLNGGQWGHDIGLYYFGSKFEGHLKKVERWQNASCLGKKFPSLVRRMVYL